MAEKTEKSLANCKIDSRRLIACEKEINDKTKNPEYAKPISVVKNRMLELGLFRTLLSKNITINATIFTRERVRNFGALVSRAIQLGVNVTIKIYARIMRMKGNSDSRTKGMLSV
ncbi:MAG: hypothetical protein Q7V19_14230, partial [Bacteroidales bacterium]|nr:hypothetical protein [Bacteroidales bacterium]